MRRAAAGSVSSADPRRVQDARLGADRPRVARLSRDSAAGSRGGRRALPRGASRLCLLAVPARSGTRSDRRDLPRAAPTTSATVPNADQAPRQQLERLRTPHHVRGASRGNLRELPVSKASARAARPPALARDDEEATRVTPPSLPQFAQSSTEHKVRDDTRTSSASSVRRLSSLARAKRGARRWRGSGRRSA